MLPGQQQYPGYPHAATLRLCVLSVNTDLSAQRPKPFNRKAIRRICPWNSLIPQKGSKIRMLSKPSGKPATHGERSR